MNWIITRANELIKKYPSQKDMFEQYVIAKKMNILIYSRTLLEQLGFYKKNKINIRLDLSLIHI
nr:hypothetical protein [Clostridioides difficile]